MSKKTLTFVTAKELDPMTASFLNCRFVGFLSRFAAEMDLDLIETLTKAQDILREAEIPQEGDQLLNEGPKVSDLDMKPFEI